MGHGFFQEYFGKETVDAYVVDTTAQICYFIGYREPAVVPCKSLAKRPAWRSVITWIGD
jgi:hypothetical protein